jgi:hypothetical protein
MLMPSIPIIIDDVKKYKKFQMTRCTYFSIECDAPASGWMLSLGDREIPFYLLGLSGIIFKPLGDKDVFGSEYLIDELFDTIEEHPSLYIDINEIWLPNFLFKQSYPERGSIYRVRDDLFTKAFSFTSNRMSEKDFLSTCEHLIENIWFSEEETKSFSEWGWAQINNAKEAFPKNPALALRWKEKKQL